jgi:hypothetical protein
LILYDLGFPNLTRRRHAFGIERKKLALLSKLASLSEEIRLTRRAKFTLLGRQARHVARGKSCIVLCAGPHLLHLHIHSPSLKDSSRDFELNCVISFLFRSNLILHVCTIKGVKNFGQNFWPTKQGHRHGWLTCMVESAYLSFPKQVFPC